MPFCPHCGRQVEAAMRFCPSCGGVLPFSNPVRGGVSGNPVRAVSPNVGGAAVSENGAGANGGVSENGAGANDGVSENGVAVSENGAGANGGVSENGGVDTSASGGATAAENADSQASDYRLILVSCDNCGKDTAREMLRNILGYSPEDAQTLTEQLPVEIAQNLTFQQALDVSRIFTEYGMRLAVHNSNGYVDISQYARQSAFTPEGSRTVADSLKNLGIANRVREFLRWNGPNLLDYLFTPRYSYNRPPQPFGAGFPNFFGPGGWNGNPAANGWNGNPAGNGWNGGAWGNGWNGNPAANGWNSGWNGNPASGAWANGWNGNPASGAWGNGWNGNPAANGWNGFWNGNPPFNGWNGR